MQSSIAHTYAEVDNYNGISTVHSTKILSDT